MGAEPFDTHENEEIHLKEIVIEKYNPWTGLKIGDLDISRQTYLLSIKRGNRTIIPKGSVKLRNGDIILMISKIHIEEEIEVEV